MTATDPSRPASLSPVRTSIHGLLEAIDGTDPRVHLKRLLAEGFFVRSDDGYLAQRDLIELLDQWRNLTAWVAQREDDEIKVRVINPNPKEHGYSLETRTVLQTCMTDQPFILDSLRLLLAKLDLPPVRVIHPIFGTERDEGGALVGLDPRPSNGMALESMMHWEIPRIEDADRRTSLEATVMDQLRSVRRVVADHEAMADRARDLGSHLSERVHGEGVDYRDVAVAQKFLHWLVDENFVFIGYAEFEIDSLAVQTDAGLGLHRADGELAFPQGGRPWAAAEGVVFLGKGDTEAQVHRPGKTDHVAIRLDGGFALFTGLYTRKAISEEIPRIPMLREKLESVLQAQAALPGSHLARKLEEAFRAIPVEFLFTTDVDAIEGAMRLIIAAEEGQETGVHLMKGPANRTAFVLVSLPRDRFNEDIRIAIADRLLETLGANYMDWRVAIGQFDNVVLQYYFTAEEQFVDVSEEALRAAVNDVTGSWTEQLEGILATGVTEAAADTLISRYGAAFPEEYHSRVVPSEAADDVELLEAVRERGHLKVALAEDVDDFVGGVKRLKVYQPEKIYLTDSAPTIANFALRIIDQSSSTISTGDEQTRFVDEFRVVPSDKGVDLGASAALLVEGLEQVLRGQSRDDSLNGLIASAGVSLREVGVLRAYIAYARQLGAADPIPTVHRAWRRHPEAAKLLLRLFRSMFKPALGKAGDADRRRLVKRNSRAFLEYLDGVDIAAEDRVLRRTWNLLSASLRTNYFSRATEEGHPLSFKVDCSKVDEMPSPRPYREIFVHHLGVEGVHLRGGPVARGGLRWSDRQADYRTEILGLMDTQMVKNVLIVPVGAKGGFILKGTYPGRSETREAADSYYKVFIRGLLDLTDNVVDGAIVPPASVVRYDGDDPYLVVAADKGTAHLSDTANGIAQDYGFWLDDAFASGGSAGYDHKKYGITAKGAWVCVRRHFRELGLDPEKDVITAVGIGDMSGDVFGNGLLLSKTVKLLAAFNHMHIFLDPDPDPASSWKERNRLFELPRSMWADYDSNLLSEGGGIFPRHAKSIRLTPQVQGVLGTNKTELSGDQVVAKILRAEADLLWNGGIGTYVKASHERDKDAGDPSNDAVRCDARDLRVRVVGEGGNLGFTQAARVEFAQLGGRVNSDAVDNSGGVDMSDHEVNLKILAADLMRAGELTLAERNKVMLEIAEEVSDDVQANNHNHSLMLSLDVARSTDKLDDFRVLLNDLEAAGRLDRGRHVLPEDGEIQRRMRNKEGLLRPELTKIGPFVKMEVYEALLDDERFQVIDVDRSLEEYFPKAVRERFGDAIRQHQLRREIAATVITNKLVDVLGVTHFSRMGRLTGRDVVEVAYASLIAAELLDSWKLTASLRDIDGVRASVEYVKLRHVGEAVSRMAQWLLLRNVDVLDPVGAIRRFRPGFRKYEKNLTRMLDRSEKRSLQKNLRYLRNRNIKSAKAERAGGLDLMVDAGEAVLLAESVDKLGVVQAGLLLKKIAIDTRLLRGRQLATPADARDGWESRAISDLNANISELTLILARKALTSYEGDICAEGGGKGLRLGLKRCWEHYREKHGEVFERATGLADRIDGARARGLGPAMVLYGAVRVLKAEA
ncbi:MAG: NAD-glutamate dehydrogenase [Proteobacteria bacterium]|nr:NAD-glutamate dehydrogenase [Pseudomonadota bacterium]